MNEPRSGQKNVLGQRPISLDKHPIAQRSYRIGTSAIEQFYRLVIKCLRYRIPGALIYARPRFGKTYAIEYIRLLLERERWQIPTFHVQCEYKLRHSEGAFFTNLLQAVRYPSPQQGTNAAKRARLNHKIREHAHSLSANRVIFFSDEAQRYNNNEYEWLRDVHDTLARDGIRLITFLVGQPQLLSQKATFQESGEEQIVARFMIEQLHFRGVESAEDAATCLQGYDETEYPEKSGWTFTCFFFPKAFEAGMRLCDQAHHLWNAFAEMHYAARLVGDIEIPMEYFSRAVEIVLIEFTAKDTANLQLDANVWRFAVEQCGYVQAQQAVRTAIADL